MDRHQVLANAVDTMPVCVAHGAKNAGREVGRNAMEP